MNKARTIVSAPIPKTERHCDVVTNYTISIALGGRGNSPKIENSLNLLRARAQIVEQVFRRHDLSDLALGKISPLISVAEPVADDDLVLAPRFEPRDQVRSDKPGAAGYDD
jgi:hypothetical protein